MNEPRDQDLVELVGPRPGRLSPASSGRDPAPTGKRAMRGAVTGIVLVVGALVLTVAISTTGNHYDTFRSAYVDRITYSDTLREPPTRLTDQQIDDAMDHVCIEGKANLQAADEVASSLASQTRGNASGFGSAIFVAVNAVGC